MRATVVFIAALAASSQAGAQSQPAPTTLSAEQRQRWQSALQRALTLSNANDHTGALQLAREAAAIQMTPRVRLFLAEEHAHLAAAPDNAQHFVDAARESAACIREATAQTTLAQRDRVIHDCTTLRDRAITHVGRVTLHVPTVLPGMRVRLNGELVDEATFETPLFFLPGPLELDASAPAHDTIHQILTVALGAHTEVTLSLHERLNDAIVTPSTSSTPFTSTATTTTTIAAPSPPANGTPLRIAGGVLIGLGVASGVVSLVSFLSASERATDAQNGTGDAGVVWQRYQDAVNFDRRMSAQQLCDRAASDTVNASAAGARDLCDAQRNAATLTLAFGITGAVLAAAGAVLMAVPSFSRGRASRALRISPMIGANTGGALLDLRF